MIYIYSHQNKAVINKTLIIFLFSFSILIGNTSIFDKNITLEAIENSKVITKNFIKSFNELDSQGVQKDLDNEITDKDMDRVKDSLDKCPNTTYGLSVNSDGRSKEEIYDYDGDGVSNNIDKCPNTLKGFKINWENGCPVCTNTTISFRIFSDKISKHSMSNIRDFAKIAMRNYNSQIIFKFNVYYKKLEEFDNQLLNEREDELIYLLETFGIHPNRIYLEELIPKKLNSSTERLKLNREVTLYLKYPNPNEDDSDRDGVLDSKDKCPDSWGTNKIDKNGCDVKDMKIDIYYKTNSSQITKHSMQSLEDFADDIMESTNKIIYLTGHTDNREKNSIDLSYERAKIIKEKLIEFGVAEYQIKIFYKGDTKPITPNITLMDKAKNRRVEIRTEYNNATALSPSHLITYSCH